MRAGFFLWVVSFGLLACSGERKDRPRGNGGTVIRYDAAVPDAGPLAINIESMTQGMVRVPAGVFRKGCEPEDDPDCGACDPKAILGCPWSPGEQDLDEFYIDRTEVTVADYARCVEARRCTTPSPAERCKPADLNWDKADRRDHPVNCITSAQAAAYCAYRGKHLPTALQFEKATRGTDGRYYPWGNQTPTCDLAVLYLEKEKPGCGRGSTWPVGSKTRGASPYGVLDLVGNVMELVTVLPGPVDPTIPDFADWAYLMAKGGSWDDIYDPLAWHLDPDDARRPEKGIGFRCAFTPSFKP